MDKYNEVEKMGCFLMCELPIEYDTVTYYDDNYTEVNIDYKKTAENFVNAG